MMEKLARFVETHRTCGELRGNVEVPRPDGYVVWIACACGEVFECCVTIDTAMRDLIHSSVVLGSK